MVQFATVPAVYTVLCVLLALKAHKLPNGLKGRFLTHAGSNGYWWARVVLLPDTESGVLLAANAGQDAGADKASDVIEKAVLPTLELQHRP